MNVRDIDLTEAYDYADKLNGVPEHLLEAQMKHDAEAVNSQLAAAIRRSDLETVNILSTRIMALTVGAALYGWRQLLADR